MNTAELFAKRIEESLTAIGSLRDQLHDAAAIADVIVERLKSGAHVYTAGNGGSASQAMHLAEEFIGRYRGNRRALPALCLNADPTALTCIANDFGFDQVFARQCEAVIRPSDVFVAFSTSGKSPNIVNALRAVRGRGGITIGLLGKDGGAAREWCDYALVVRGDLCDSAHIQEAHEVVLHLVCEAVERALTTVV